MDTQKRKQELIAEFNKLKANLEQAQQVARNCEVRMHQIEGVLKEYSLIETDENKKSAADKAFEKMENSKPSNKSTRELAKEVVKDIKKQEK